MTVSAFRALPEVDQLLALGLALYEGTLCSGCGQPLHLSMDGDLLDEWSTVTPHRCGACSALERAHERIQEGDWDQPRALKIEPGLREGWESRLEKVRAERAAKAAADSDRP